ncbi:MAG: ParB N-terminal domain-containing protein [Deltaproteobacteria bacterium]|nr:ParB N-terminal domain-containing protein [Deltaproteobacteria bacterium]
MATKKKAAGKPRGKSRKPDEARGPAPAEAALAPDAPEVQALVTSVEARGGRALAVYRDPFAGSPLVLASVPVKSVAETPFQRDLSRTHADRLVAAIRVAGAFLDPVIAVEGPDGFLSPNGRHRLAAARQLGMRAITVLLVPDRAMAFRILALNTEKAHNLRDRSLEVVRMARALALEAPRSSEAEHEAIFEAPLLVTLGQAYETAGRFAGSAWQPMLRRVDRWLPGTLPAALRQREQYAQRLMQLDTMVNGHVAALQARGLKSPYLKTLVVARCNPVREFAPTRKKDAAPPMTMAVALTKMDAALRKFDPAKVRAQDLALVAAVAPEEG